MDDSIDYMPEYTKLVVDEYEKIRIALRKAYNFTDVDLAGFEAPHIKMLYFMTCMDPESMCYGTAAGSFVYKDRRVFSFHYNIHIPHAKGPRISNMMTDIKQIVMKEMHGSILPEKKETSFGREAFLSHIPIGHLDEESKDLRRLMKSLQSYCRKEELCKKLRKTDKAHLEWEKSLNL